MPVTERVQALGDWSLQLRPDTPWSVRNSISTPFSQIVITEGRLPISTLTDTVALASSIYTGVMLRPGPQLGLSGVGLQWYLGGTDTTLGPGLATTLTISAGSLSTAMTTVLSGTGLSSGTISAGTVAAYSGADVLRLVALRQLADQLGFEYRIKPNLTVDVGTSSTLYGATPTAVVVRRTGPREMASPYGLVGTVDSTWDWEGYASAAIVWTTSQRATAGGASTYRNAAGSAMTIYRGWEFTDAPSGAAGGIATQLLSTVDRAVRTVEVTSSDYAVTGTVACGASIFIYDVDLKLTDTTNQQLFGGSVIHPVSARVMSVTWPIQRGMGVYVRSHNGTSASYVDLTDYIEWESGDTRFEVSTAAQVLAPQRSTTLQDLWSPWQSYAAEWRAQTGPDPAIGNGTITASYRRLGTALSLKLEITSGTTSTYGVGTMAVTMPPSCVARTGGGTQLGESTYQSAAGAVHPGTAYVFAGGTTIYFAVDTSPWTYADGNTNTPFTWAAGSKINLNMTIEIDP